MPVKLAVTIDVEEEGLFSGKYNRTDIPVENVKELQVLDSVFREWDIRPTLLLTYQVARDKRSHDLLHNLRHRWNGEIGAHLHHWNTPPIKELPYRDPVPSELMPHDLLAAKLDSLIEAINQAGFIPESFRMGRFNLGPRTFALIHNLGIKVDSSVCPLHRFYGGPDHLGAPTDPYFPDLENILKPGKSDVLEAPVTIAPFINGIGEYFQFLCDYKIVPANWVAWFSQKRGFLAGPAHVDGHKAYASRGGSPYCARGSSADRFFSLVRAYGRWMSQTSNERRY